MKHHASYYQSLIINEKIFLQNIRTLQVYYKKPLGVVVKGHAYGHDLLTAAKLFVKAGVGRLICYHLSDAITLRKQHNQLSILLIGPISRKNIEQCKEYNIELTIWELSFWESIQKVIPRIESSGEPLKLHFEIETGMHRTGIPPDEIKQKIGDLFRHPQIQCLGFCTHLSGADESDNIDRVHSQIQVFRNFRAEIEKEHPQIKGKLEWHGPNSAGLMIEHADVFTSARTGILAYGFFPSPYALSRWPSDQYPAPKPAIEWKSRIAGRQRIPNGQFTGYGKTHKTSHEVDTVMIPTGYGDGFPRSFSNRWKIKIGREYWPIIGRVNMNQIIVDVSGLPFRPEETEVTLISADGPFGWDAAAEQSGRFIYELLTGISPKIERQVQ